MSAQHTEQQNTVKRPLKCNHCSLPFARVKDGRLVIQSRHDSSQHTNSLTAEELRRLADEMERKQ